MISLISRYSGYDDWNKFGMDDFIEQGYFRESDEGYDIDFSELKCLTIT